MHGVVKKVRNLKNQYYYKKIKKYIVFLIVFCNDYKNYVKK